MRNTITYIAMDTHKKEHKAALHYPCNEEIIRFAVKNNARDIKKMVNKIKKQAPADIKFCYEAGVCGFTLKRRIEARGLQMRGYRPITDAHKAWRSHKDRSQRCTKAPFNVQSGLAYRGTCPKR